MVMSLMLTKKLLKVRNDNTEYSNKLMSSLVAPWVEIFLSWLFSIPVSVNMRGTILTHDSTEFYIINSTIEIDFVSLNNYSSSWAILGINRQQL